MDTRSFIRTLFVAISCLVLAPVASHATLINIDTFDVGEQYVAGGSSDTIGGLSASEVIGGQRYFSVSGNARQIHGEINSIDYVGEGSYASGPRYGGSFTLEYGRSTDLNAVLSAEGEFQFDFTYVDPGAGTGSNTLVITVIADNQTDSYQLDWPASEGLVSVSASRFDDVTAWNSVDRLTFTFNARTAADVTLNTIIFSVPEPATLGLLAVGGVIGLLRRRRR